MPQPIDPTTEIARTAAVERIQQLAARTDLHAHARHVHQLAEEQVSAETEVFQPEAKSDEVEQDLRRRNPYRGKRKHRNPESTPEQARTFYTANEKTSIVEDDEPHGLDVTI